MSSDIDATIIDAVDGALRSLTEFLTYAELPCSAQQVKKIRSLLQTVIAVEQRSNRTSSTLACETGDQGQTKNDPVYRRFLYPYG